MSNQKKTNPNKIPLTLADLKKAEKKWEQEKQDLFLRASQYTSMMYQAVTYLALCNVHRFTTQQLADLQAEMDRISLKIMAKDGKHRNYSLHTVLKELRKYDVELDEDELRKIEEGGTL